GGKVLLESGFNYDVIMDLRKMGHDVNIWSGGYGGYQAIMYNPETGVYFGASESRKDGQAAGY
ncbi:MAG: gamma-glutamyltransferase, partial [Bacteroidetes bacterium]|nr:gamma-glutamyltransferase [Bacteroidota bacterium]